MTKISHVLPAIGFVPRNPDDSAYGGITMTAWQLASRQSQNNHVNMLGLSREGEPFSVVYKDVGLRGIRPWRWASFGRFDLHYIAPMLRRLVFDRPDILHGYTDPTLLLLPAQYRILHLQNVLRPSNSVSTLRALTRADAIICCSHYVRDELVRQFPTVSDVSVVVHNGGTKHIPASSHIREKWAISDDALVILFVGAVTPEKGLHILIEAVARIVPEIDNVHLLVAGSSQLWYSARARDTSSEYERKLVIAGTRLPIYFLGRVSQKDIGEVYSAADVFVAPSVWDEPFGITVVEALAAGLPVVASSVGGIPEIVNEDVGILVPPGDSDALAAALRKLLQDERLRSTLAANATSRADLFSWNKTATGVNQVYRDIQV